MNDFPTKWILLAYIGAFVHTTHSTVFNIGFLLNNENLKVTINHTIHDINTSPEYFGLGSNRINVSWHILSKDPLKATRDICEHLVAKRTHLMITTNAVNESKSPDIVSYIGAFYKIPVIAIQARDSELTDKKKHPTLLRTVPPYFDQARGWANLLRSFKWNKVNLIASNDYDGRITYIKFTSWAYKYNIVIEKTILLNQENENISSQLLKVNETRTKVNLLACSEQDCSTIFKVATQLGITSKGFIWISNQQSITGESLKNVPHGLLALRLQKEGSKKSHIHDAINVAAMALGRLKSEELIEPPSSCHQAAGQWKAGDVLYQNLLNTSMNGTTGDISFDWYGDRKDAVYQLLNVRREEDSAKARTKLVGILYDDVKIDINMTDIIWPGNQTEVTEGIFISSHLRIVTVESRPFVYVVPMHSSGNCSGLDYTDSSGKIFQHLQCDGPSDRYPGRQHCCKGFCMDLLLELAKKVNFTYDIHLVEDGKFGSLKKVNGSNIKRWNGMVGELVEGKADLVMASLTINNDRAQYIEYSKPFKYQGITILVRKKEVPGSLASFLLPFKPLLWVLVLISVHVVAIILYLLDRFSPFGRYRLTQSNKEETALNLSSAVWFSWGVLLNSGIGESTPRSFSARVLGMVWAGFAMIIVASYTANLAAFLVLDRPQPVVTGVDDPLMRNPSDKFPYGTVMNSSVDAYFRRQVELSSMYTFMETYNVKTEQAGIEMVKNGSLKAFIWDSPVLIHEKSNSCSLTTVGELFGRSGYGIGMPKGSSWSNNISLAILYMHESGKMEEFNSKWIDVGKCKTENRQPATLGLKHMLGVFIMVAAGIGAGIVIVVLEVLYYKQKGWRKEQRKVVKKTADIWQGHVQERKQQRHHVSHQASNGVATENGFTMNGNATHEQSSDAVGEPNPIYSNDHCN